MGFTSKRSATWVQYHLFHERADGPIHGRWYAHRRKRTRRAFWLLFYALRFSTRWSCCWTVLWSFPVGVSIKVRFCRHHTRIGRNCESGDVAAVEASYNEYVNADVYFVVHSQSVVSFSRRSASSVGFFLVKCRLKNCSGFRCPRNAYTCIQCLSSTVWAWYFDHVGSSVQNIDGMSSIGQTNHSPSWSLQSYPVFLTRNLPSTADWFLRERGKQRRERILRTTPHCLSRRSRPTCWISSESGDTFAAAVMIVQERYQYHACLVQAHTHCIFIA